MERCNFKPETLTVDVCNYMFVEWLIRRGLYSKFIANLSPARYNANSPRCVIREIVAGLISSPHFALSDVISSSFIFRSTPEGSGFWLGVSEEWKNYLEMFLHVI